MDELNSYYKDQLIDQLESLIELCASYDSGNFTRAKGMSAIIRTMVKDPIPRSGKKSDTVSLLKTLNIKDDMKFYNTAYEAVDPEFMFNLVGFVTVPTKNVKEHFDDSFQRLLYIGKINQKSPEIPYRETFGASRV